MLFKHNRLGYGSNTAVNVNLYGGPDVDSLLKKSGQELSELIKGKAVSSVEVIEAHLERIRAINPYLNAVTLPLEESALEAAEKADNGTDLERRRPLHGVPFTIKENIDVLGTPTTNGLPILAEAMPSRNDPIVERMIQAGAIPIGRTNLPEMGMRLDTDNPLRGRTINPWNAGLTPGGSSGGDAAAIATGMTPMGLGNDIGGSLRNPAYCCGIKSLKPSMGRLPWAPSIEPIDMGIPRLLLSNGPMTRSVRDLGLMLSILSGRHVADPESIDVPLHGTVPVEKKAAIVTNLPKVSLPNSTTKAIVKAGKILEKAGWVVEEVEVPELERVHEVWSTLLAPLTASLPRELFKPETRAYLDRISDLHLELDFGHALRERQRLMRLYSGFFKKFTVCIGPIWGNLPWPINSDLDPNVGNELLRQSFSFITPGNCLGLPAVALSTGVADGLPTGIQIYSELYRDDLCLLAAEIIESSSDQITPIEPIK